MKLEEITGVDALSNFLSGSQAILFEVASSKTERYEFVELVARKTGYLGLKRKEKHIVRRFLIKITCFSDSQLTRLLKKYKTTGKIIYQPSRTNGFNRKYTLSDISLLAEMDKRYDFLSGGTTQKLCERAYDIFGDSRFERLRKISVAHIYRLRQSKRYLQLCRTFTKTQPNKVAIGVRKKPFTDGRAGFIRIDTVHQGDLEKTKGVYHINAIDEVTQYEVVLSVEYISERYLEPILTEILATFPFVVLGFHSDNGSEFINGTVVKLLNKLHIEQTKSRPRQSNDNALAESKNASVVRKLFGKQHAKLLNVFHREHLTKYLNYHRPCYFAKIITDEKGKAHRKYPVNLMMTPYEKLKSLPAAKYTLKPEVIFSALDKEALEISDNKAKDQLNLAYQALMRKIFSNQADQSV